MGFQVFHKVVALVGADRLRGEHHLGHIVRVEASETDLSLSHSSQGLYAVNHRMGPPTAG